MGKLLTPCVYHKFVFIRIRLEQKKTYFIFNDNVTIMQTTTKNFVILENLPKPEKIKVLINRSAEFILWLFQDPVYRECNYKLKEKSLSDLATCIMWTCSVRKKNQLPPKTKFITINAPVSTFKAWEWDLLKNIKKAIVEIVPQISRI